MPSSAEMRARGYTVVNRLNILKAKFDNLTRPDRESFKDDVEDALHNFSLDLIDRLRAATPESEEDPDIYSLRQKGWAKYGEQSYLYNTSTVPEIRKHLVSIKRGWGYPTLDYSFSGVNRVGINIRFTNMAPHAPLAILGEYKQSSWKIPKTEMHGGRKLLMWGYNGRPVFKWIVVQGITVPITQRAPSRKFDWMIGMIERELRSEIPNIVETVKKSLTREFKSV